MLVELLVENFAVADRVRVRFGPGLNVLSGETGSGKSLIVDSLGLLFGGRADSDAVRSGAERARITGIFEVSRKSGLVSILEAAGVEAEEGELIVEREIGASGKSRAFVGSKLVTVALLKNIAPYLGDLHGQHDQQRLFDLEEQRVMLDQYAGLEPQVEAAGKTFRELQGVEKELRELEQREQEILRQRDLWSFQKTEIEAAGLKPGEDVALDNELRVLANVMKLKEQSLGALEALSGEASALESLRTAIRRLVELRRIDESIGGLVESLRSAEIAIDEAVRDLDRYNDRLEADPARLGVVEHRLAEIDKLRRKYGQSIEEILSFYDQVSQDLNLVEGADERRQQLRQRAERLRAEFGAAAAELSSARRKAAGSLERKIEAELKDLNMERSRFLVHMEKGEWGPTGFDEIEYRISTNLGEDAKALTKVASGGELSRVALALKVALTSKVKKQEGRTLVFDEVDAGIGGSAAEQVAKKLKRLAGTNQLICVTHLAQIAAFGEQHFSVEKREAKGRTYSVVEELNPEQRVQEVGRMLGGQSLTAEGLKYAAQLIEKGQASAA